MSCCRCSIADARPQLGGRRLTNWPDQTLGYIHDLIVGNVCEFTVQVCANRFPFLNV